MPDKWSKFESAPDKWSKFAEPEDTRSFDEKYPPELLQQVEDEVRFEQIYGKKAMEDNPARDITGAIVHGLGDSLTLGAKNKILRGLDKTFGTGQRDFDLEERYFKDKYPVTNLVSGLLGAFVTPGGKEVSGAIKGGKTAEELTRASKIIAKTAGISTDAALAAIYNFMRSGEGEGLKDAATGAELSLGISAGLSGLGALGKKLNVGPKIAQFLFGLPEDIQNKIKANPDIIKNAKSPDELVEKLINVTKQVGKEAGESSKTAASKLSSDLWDVIPAERLRGIIQSEQEALGDVAGLPLKEKSFRRLEKLKSQFPTDQLFTPSSLKPVVQDLDQEIGDYLRTSGVTGGSLKNVRRGIDEILKENPEYASQMKDTASLTRLADSLRKKFGLKEVQDVASGSRELIPSQTTYSMLNRPDRLGKTERLLQFLDQKIGSDLAQDVEKTRMAEFLSKPQNQASRLVITGAAAGLPFGPYGTAAGAAAGKYLDKFGRSTGADILAAGSKASDFLNENKLFKEILSKDSNLNRKYAASHFIRSQVDPDYNKESSK